MTLKTSIDTLVADAAIAHSIIHGGSAETVSTEGGSVPSLAKAIADMVAYWGTLGMTLASAGTISAAPGSVGAPSLIWGGDLTTGIYRIGANNLGVAVSGVKRLDISASGLGVTGSLTVGGAASAFIQEAKYNELLAGADAGGFYFATGFGINPAVPVFIGNTGTTELRHVVRSTGVITNYVNGASRLSILAGGFAIPATNKFYLDGIAGTGDTYLVESSANVVDFYAGGVRSMLLGSAGARFTSGDGTYQIGVIGTTKGIRIGTGASGSFIQGVDSTLVASYQQLLLGGSRIDFEVSGTVQFNTITAGIGKPSTASYLALTGGITPSSDGATIYLAGATYVAPNQVFIDSSVVNFRNISGASPYASVISTGIALPATNRLHMDGIAGSGDTYLVESSANVLDAYAGGNKTLSLNASGAAVVGYLTTTTAITAGGTIQSYVPAGGAKLRFGSLNYAISLEQMGDTGLLRVRRDDGATTPIADFTNGYLALGSGIDFVAAATSKVRLDGNTSGDTYIVESSADTLRFYAGGINQLQLAAGGVTLGLDGSYSHVLNGTFGQTTRNNTTAFNITGATTGWSGYRVANTSGALFMGVASSAGTLFTGSSAYSSALGTEGNYPLDFATNSTVRVSISGAGNVTFNGEVRLATKTPASASATGTTGTVAWDANYLYVCTATDTWKRAALATW